MKLFLGILFVWLSGFGMGAFIGFKFGYCASDGFLKEHHLALVKNKNDAYDMSPIVTGGCQRLEYVKTYCGYILLSDLKEWNKTGWNASKEESKKFNFLKSVEP